SHKVRARVDTDEVESRMQLGELRSVAGADVDYPGARERLGDGGRRQVDAWLPHDVRRVEGVAVLRLFPMAIAAPDEEPIGQFERIAPHRPRRRPEHVQAASCPPEDGEPHDYATSSRTTR